MLRQSDPSSSPASAFLPYIFPFYDRMIFIIPYGGFHEALFNLWSANALRILVAGVLIVVKFT